MDSRRLKFWGKMIALGVLLYLFFVGLDLMGAAFKSFGQGFAERLIETTSNPFLGLMIGLLATSLVQSSSMTTSMTVAMVSAGALTIEGAIPIVLGANIGTSVTNIIVSMGHISRPEEFRRALAGATVHDVFNCFAVLIFLPLELSVRFLSRLSGALEAAVEGAGGIKMFNPVKALVKPGSEWIGDLLFDQGLFMLIVGIGLLFLSLRYLVRLLKSTLAAQAEDVLNRTLFRSAWSAVLAGALITAVVQSSSITTSVVIPLVGAGVLTVEQAFPYTIGANVGTTVTAILAALSIGNPAGVTVAFAHLCFNVSGGLVIYGIPFLRKIPIRIAKALGNFGARSRVATVGYVIIFFFGLPILFLFLSGTFDASDGAQAEDLRPQALQEESPNPGQKE